MAKNESKFDRVKTAVKSARATSKSNIERFSKEELPRIGKQAYESASGAIGGINTSGEKGAGFIGKGIKRLIDKIKGKGGSATEKFEEVMSKVDRPAVHKADAVKRAEMMKNVPSKETRVARKTQESKNARMTEDIKKNIPEYGKLKPLSSPKGRMTGGHIDLKNQTEAVETLRLKDRFNKSKGRYTKEKVEGKNVSQYKQNAPDVDRVKGKLSRKNSLRAWDYKKYKAKYIKE